jgi:single-strand DNA-binding protein
MGNLGKDPEAKQASNGNSFCTFSVATSESWKDKTTGEKQTKTQWHNCISYGKQSEVIAKFFKKGSKILIVGAVEYSEKDGKYFTNVKVNEFHFVDSKSDSQQTAPTNIKAVVASSKSNSVTEDDLPF